MDHIQFQLLQLKEKDTEGQMHKFRLNEFEPTTAAQEATLETRNSTGQR